MEFVRWVFRELKDRSPLPNIYTYTIMMNFCCSDVGCDAGIRQAAVILGKIYRSGEKPTVVTLVLIFVDFVKLVMLRLL